MSIRRAVQWSVAGTASLLGACVLGSVVGPNRAIVQDAAALVEECRYEEAEALIKVQLTTIPERYRAELRLAQGQIEEARGQLGPAIEHYAAAAAARSAPHLASRLLGRAQVRSRQFEEGYRTLADLHPDRSPLLARDFDWRDMAALAVAAAETGRLAEAASALTEAYRLASQPYDPVIPELRALVAEARATPATVAPGSFWTPAYANEGVGLALDARPVLVHRDLPEVPFNAKAERAGGQILLFLDISETGKVVETKVVEAEPPGRLEAKSVAAVREWKFEPAMHHCRAVASAGFQRFEFGPGR